MYIPQRARNAHDEYRYLATHPTRARTIHHIDSLYSYLLMDCATGICAYSRSWALKDWTRSLRRVVMHQYTPFSLGTVPTSRLLPEHCPADRS